MNIVNNMQQGSPDWLQFRATRFGSSEATAAVIEFADITGRINAYAADKADAFYLELLAKPGVKKPRPPAPAPVAETDDSSDA